MDTNTDNIKMPASIRSKYPDKDTKIHVRSKPATNYLYSERITLKHPLPNSEQDDSVPPIQSCRFSPVPIQSRPIQSRRFSPPYMGPIQSPMIFIVELHAGLVQKCCGIDFGVRMLATHCFLSSVLRGCQH
uniref:Uncharacterized protein n=1 Tax=Meloidogyne incognita TaxID=6306 RepID=A0A914LNR5_MELIC